jgi:hypothetical protein
MVNPVFAATAVLGVLLPLLPTKSERGARRLYWIGALIATVSAFFALYPPDWRGGLGLAGALGVGLLLRAYMSTSHIVIRGRTYAFNLANSRPRPVGARAKDDPASDSYGGMTTAPKTWWLLVVIVLACTLMVALSLVTNEGPWYAIGALLFLAVIALSIGYQDSSWEYPVARRQLVQFTVAGIASVGTFTVLYLIAYAVGKRWPLRPKRSMEYRAHPHLRKKFP